MSPRPSPVAPPDLYAITDPNLSPLSVIEQVEQFVAGGARIVQLRHKLASDAEFSVMARECMRLCHAGGATFIINDRVDIAAVLGADGVHVGERDMSVLEARRRLGDERVIGLSTHSAEQFQRALALPLDYIALGPVFTTSTKPDAAPAVGLELVEQAAFELEGDHRPLVLIGGISLANINLVRAVAPRAFVAAISDVLCHPDIAARVRLWRETLGAKRAD